MEYSVEVFSFQNIKGEIDLSFVIEKQDSDDLSIWKGVLSYSEPTRDPEAERIMKKWVLPIDLEPKM